jgi:heme-degrading monooxygenase HmoA
MFVHISIHYPKPDKQQYLIESMHRFGKAMGDKKGLIMVHTLKDEESNKLVGLAIWESKEDWLAARSAMINAVKDDPFEEWEMKDPDVYHLNVI